MSKGQVPNPITDNELNELRNLKKKVDYLKDKLEERGDGEEEAGHSGSEDEDEEEVAEVQPKKKNIKAQRAGVSAEVYGARQPKPNSKKDSSKRSCSMLSTRRNSRLSLMPLKKLK
jgi:hypothetical protein